MGQQSDASLWALLCWLLLALPVNPICYFPAVYQGEFVSQAGGGEAGGAVSYSTISVLYDSIPVWGYCHRRVGSSVILMDDTGGLTCYRCFTLNLRSSNVLQVFLLHQYIVFCPCERSSDPVLMTECCVADPYPGVGQVLH